MTDAPAPPPRVSRLPALTLVLATLFWGMGFSWAKNVGDAINHAAGRPTDAPLGPLVGLTLRFTAATLVWLAVVPASRGAWTRQTLLRGTTIGSMLALGLILQHLGLGRTDEATVAFLTNLTVVLVPGWAVAVTRQTPPIGLMIAVPMALAGMVLLCGVGPVGSVSGALFGVGCAVAFAAEILLLDRLGQGESAARLTVLLLAIPAVASAIALAAVSGVADIDWHAVVTPAVMVDLVPLTGLTTLAAFALMTAYQPRVDPTRASIIYLCEPLFAAAFAWFYNGRSMTAEALAGAGLILGANVVADWKWRRV